MPSKREAAYEGGFFESSCRSDDGGQGMFPALPQPLMEEVFLL